MSKDPRDTATLILIKRSHFNRTAMYNNFKTIKKVKTCGPSPWTTLTSMVCRIQTCIEAWLFNLAFYHSKGKKQRALHVHQRKTEHFIEKLFAEPFMLPHT